MLKFNEITLENRSIYKENGSKFISYSYIVYSEKEAKKYLQKIRKIEISANHYCYAYMINHNKSIFKLSDDGEPKSTAGKPILGQINANNLSNILIVVVRYFGGKKLGISGLIKSYKSAASDVIKKSNILEKMIENHYKITFKFSDTNKVMIIIKKYKLNIIESKYDNNSTIIFTVPLIKNDIVINLLSKLNNIKIEHLKQA